MTEVTIVTAFFPVGREDWQIYTRSNDKYIEYFRFWGRIQNKLIVYTDRETAKAVLEIREEFNLKHKTQVIIVEDVYSLEPTVYAQIEAALKNPVAVQFRTCPKNPESWNPKYNYVTYLKPYFTADAVKKGYAAGQVAWVDFGYNHGGESCIHAEEFDFLWEYDFSSKIHLFAMEEIDDMPIFEIVRTMRAYIAGAVMVAPADLWPEFARLYKESMLHLTHCGLADDDQTISVMAYRAKPELFEIHLVDDWFTAIKEVGGSHLTRAEKVKYKETKKQAKTFLKDKKYTKALQWYFKYAREKAKAKR
jgi:protein YibB